MKSEIETRSAAVADSDVWFAWLLGARHGGDAAYAAALGRETDAIRDTVLGAANLRPFQTIADIGCGDGLVGFGALHRQPTSEVTFVDISPKLLEYCRHRAERRRIADRCRFIVASGDALAAIPSDSIDVVLVRAVLAYIPDRAAAVREMRRVLRPGGRISLADPIFVDQALELAGMRGQLQRGGDEPGLVPLELLHRLRAAYLPDTLDAIHSDPLTNYNERDLLRLFEMAGFVNVGLRLHIDSGPALPFPWDAFLASAPRAGMPVFGEVLHTRFSSGERRSFEQFFRATIEAGTATDRRVNAYLFGDAPG